MYQVDPAVSEPISRQGEFAGRLYHGIDHATVISPVRSVKRGILPLGWAPGTRSLDLRGQRSHGLNLGRSRVDQQTTSASPERRSEGPSAIVAWFSKANVGGYRAGSRTNASLWLAGEDDASRLVEARVTVPPATIDAICGVQPRQISRLPQQRQQRANAGASPRIGVNLLHGEAATQAGRTVTLLWR